VKNSINKKWTVSHILSPFFLGRRKHIENIFAALRVDVEASQSTQKCYVITGARGLGKSELCLKVANAVRDE
jgi:hypothetical protein